MRPWFCDRKRLRCDNKSACFGIENKFADRLWHLSDFSTVLPGLMRSNELNFDVTVVRRSTWITNLRRCASWLSILCSVVRAIILGYISRTTDEVAENYSCPVEMMANFVHASSIRRLPISANQSCRTASITFCHCQYSNWRWAEWAELFVGFWPLAEWSVSE